MTHHSRKPPGLQLSIQYIDRDTVDWAGIPVDPFASGSEPIGHPFVHTPEHSGPSGSCYIAIEQGSSMSAAHALRGVVVVHDSFLFSKIFFFGIHCKSILI